jgi:leucyl aminopeptidase
VSIVSNLSFMNLKVVHGDLIDTPTQAIVVNLFDGVHRPGGATGAINDALNGAISSLIDDGEIKGKQGESTLIHTLGKMPAKRVLIMGLGKQEDFTLGKVRDITADSCRILRRLGLESATSIAHGAGIGGLETSAVAQAMAEGTLLGLYRFDKYLTKSTDQKQVFSDLQIIEQDASKINALKAGLEQGRVIAEATILARDMVNEPANVMTPTNIAEIAQQVAQSNNLEIEVFSTQRAQELGMGAFLGVARGSHQPPQFIALRYWGDPENPDNNLGLLGKGITFDTGGISLKAAASMSEMKTDMSGAAAVISAMQAIAQLKPTINVTALAPCTENMPGGDAQRPGDIVRAMNGKSIEVDNTDAEGRLALADALGYAHNLNLKRLVDIATLTGAIVTSLGNLCSGGFTNNQELMDQVVQSGEQTGERIWQLPMFDEYKDLNHSEVADIKNTGGRGAGSITAAHFLREFTEDTPWVHLDIAGTAFSSRVKGHIVKGATGVPVRTLVNLTLELAK